MKKGIKMLSDKHLTKYFVSIGETKQVINLQKYMFIMK